MIPTVMRFCPTSLTKFLPSLCFKIAFYSSKAHHSKPSLVKFKNMKVKILPALKDNYMYLIIDEVTNRAAAVDPVEPTKIINAVNDEKAELTTVLTTHHHWDHAGGNAEIKKLYPKIEIVGGDDRIEGLTKKVSNGDKLSIGELIVQCLSTPCHTKGHICYYFDLKDEAPAVFTGDTLFTGGCGRFFEGSALEMYNNLIEILGSLPNSTRVFSGHEYAVNNLTFAKHLDPSDMSVHKRLDWALQLRQLNHPTVPSTIGDEKMTNPFMRVCDKYMQDILGLNDPISTMQILRQKKDRFTM